jgi:aminoglycoside phosphotransferase (APT) family kinase protein
MPRLSGAMGSTVWEAADDTTKVDLAAAHGAALAELHCATFDAPGPYDPQQESFVAESDFGRWTLERIELLRTRSREIDALTSDDELYVDALVDSCSDALDEPFIPVLVHHDFSLANTNYELRRGRYCATGLFDLGEAHIGDGEEDLVRFLFRRKRLQRAAFVETYTAERPFRAGAPERLALYALADCLFLWEVSRRVTNWFGDACFADVAKPVVDTARSAAR